MYNDISSVTSHWAKNQEKALKIRDKFGERAFIVSFRDLILETEKVMKRFCEIFGLRFEGILTVPTFNKVPIRSNTVYKDSVVSGSISRKPLDRYKEQLSSADIRHINKKQKDLIEEMESMSNMFYSSSLFKTGGK